MPLDNKRDWHWLEHCRSCNRKHYFRWDARENPICYGYPAPVSEKVYENCRVMYECDGCEAYRDHF